MFIHYWFASTFQYIRFNRSLAIQKLEAVSIASSHLISDEKPFEFGIRLEVDNFSKVPIDEKIFSHPCVVHNLAWRIMVKRTEHMGKSRLGFFLVVSYKDIV